MRRFVIVLTLCFLATLSAIHTSAQPVLSITQVITGLSSPMQLVNAGDGSNRIFIVQKEGSILVYNKTYAFLDTFLKVTSDFRSEGERGLLSMAFHPHYVNNGFFIFIIPIVPEILN